MNKENNETKKTVEPQFAANGLPIWKTEEGIVEGYKREHFFQNVKKDDKELRKTAQAEFFTYLAELSDVGIARHEAIIEKMKARKEKHLQKAQDVMHEPTPEEKKQRELARIEKRAQKIREELGL